MKNNCCGGNSLPSSNNKYMLEMEQLKREVKELLKQYQTTLLCQNQKINETMVYIKNNLSNSLQELLDSMIQSGELEDLINETITDISATVENLEDESVKFYLYNPSLLNSEDSESISLLLNDNYAILFDCGRETSIDEEIEYLRSKLCDRKLNALIISHYHLDHVGGLSKLISLMNAGTTVYLPMNFVNYLNSTTDDIEELIAIRDNVISLLEENNISYTEINSDTTLTYGEIKVKLRNSNVNAYTYYNQKQSRYNAYSMNALICLGENKVLLPADSNIDTQDYLLSVGQVEKVSIYASAHHGIERYQNTEYLDILNPDYEYFSISPLTWNAVLMTNYDYALRNKSIQYSTEAFGNVEYLVTKHDSLLLEGYYAKENMYINKRLDVYVNSEYGGIPDGSSDRPFKTLSECFSYLPECDSDITIHLATGTYEAIRIMNTPNLIKIVSDDNEVTLTNVQVINCGAVYFKGINFINNVTCSYGFVYFNECNFSCESSTSGNICVSLSRINASFGSCNFSNCYTGIYGESNSQITSNNCSFDCSGYAVYGKNSYISLDEYTLTNGQLREEPGCNIITTSRGNTSNVPNFNNSNYMRGYKYFATNLGYPIFYFNHDNVDHWVNSSGTDVI